MSLALAGVLSAYNNAPAGTVPPLASAAASVATSMAPSGAVDAVVTVLNELDAAIASNQTPTGLTAEEQPELQGIADSIRTAIETGDLSAARPAFNELSTKVDDLAAKLDSEAGTTLNDAVNELRTLLGA